LDNVEPNVKLENIKKNLLTADQNTAKSSKNLKQSAKMLRGDGNDYKFGSDQKPIVAKR
jgi:hypothetical protein